MAEKKTTVSGPYLDKGTIAGGTDESVFKFESFLESLDPKCG